MRLQDEQERPVLILTIANGAGHTRAAEAIASALCSASPKRKVRVLDVADYMTRTARFTHVKAYLWLVKYAPALWDYIDRYQKRQTHTSPEWYYRRGLRRLFELAQSMKPCALVATEVGCCEIAALIKRDLRMTDVPLVAVNVNYDADRAWVQDEVNLFCAATERVREELIAHGAKSERIRVWGVPLGPEFKAHVGREEERARVCRRLGLAPQLPLVLVAGGSEGLGRIEEVAERLLRLEPVKPQVIVMAGRNERLRRRCERLADNRFRERLRVLGWTEQVAELMRAADLSVSKLGNAFDEAMASRLPLVALPPPPGSERIQYELLDEWGVGRAVRSLDELAGTISYLLSNDSAMAAMRANAHAHSLSDAATRIAEWLSAKVGSSHEMSRETVIEFNDRAIERCV